MEISILGCGWLGFPLAQQLISEGHRVKGSTTTDKKLTQLKEAGIPPFKLLLDPEFTTEPDPDFWKADVLVLNIPPGRRRDNVEDYHPRQVKSVLEKVHNSQICLVVYASSTSVYPHGHGLVHEEDAGDPDRASGRALLKAESMLMEESAFRTTVVRLGGLYGYGRHPVRYLAGRRDLDKGNAPVNLIHRDDAVQIFSRIINDDVHDTVLNACSDGHPPRSEFYRAAACYYELDPPTFADDDRRDYKIVSNEKLKNTLSYQFFYPNPMDFTP